MYFEPWDSEIDKYLFQTYISNHAQFVKVASFNHSILGFIVGTITNSEKARIYTIVVDPQYQEQTIGKNLVINLEKALKNHMKLKYLTIRIPKSKFETEGFFIKLEFKVVSILNCYERKKLTFQEITPPHYTIRKASIEDIPRLLEIENACFSEFWRMRREELISQLHNPLSIIFVACDKNKILGYNYSRVSKNVGNYIRIATHPSEQHKHVAKSLTSQTFSWFRSFGNITKVLLSTYANSSQHNQMYQKWGFNLLDQEMILVKKYF
ncbi:MAG: GNAT family N-acetyltransferase [Candidatus Hodarchaeales archaeon]